jgi:hypothetical protein
MADPLSITAGVVGIATATINTAKALCAIIDDIKDGPGDIESVSRDAHAFYSIIFSLLATLKEDKVRHVVERDVAMVEMIRNLYRPLPHCQALLGELMVQIQKQLKWSTDAQGSRRIFVIVNWTFFTKGKIRALQVRLEASKSTLCSASNAFSLYVLWHSVPGLETILTKARLCSVRLLALGESVVARSVIWSSKSINFSFGNLELKPATDGEEALSGLGKQVSNPLTSLVCGTQHAFTSEDYPLQRHLAQIHQELGGSCPQTNLLEPIFRRHEKSKSGRQLVSNGGTAVPKRLVHQPWESVPADEQDLSAVDIFYDCVSRLSVDGLETKSSFYPEQYSTEGVFSERIFVIAMLRSQDDHRKLQCFLMYAENPRRWHRITISATFHRLREQAAVLQVSAIDNNDGCCKILPKAFQSLLDPLLPQLEFFSSVTNLSLSLEEEESGQIVIRSRGINAAEDTLEVHMSDEDRILQEIEHLGCRKIFESDVIVPSRISSSSYHVLLDTRKCIEQKAPFASAGRLGENGFRDFCEDLKLIHSLRGCAGVVQFIGVVLDETERHLKSYLYESPMIGSLSGLFVIANLQSERVPWLIREIWSRQIIKAISEVHGKNKVVGILSIYNIGLRVDGTAVLIRLKTSYRHIINTKGAMPPELREPSERHNGVAPDVLNFETDIFQLGLILWLLAEHRPNCDGYLCAISRCTKFPRYTCVADHANPVELPACCGDIPSSFTDIIPRCRLPNSRARPSARSLMDAFPYTGEIRDRAPGIVHLLDVYAPKVAYFSVHCDACGMLAKDFHYHCNICFKGDFDLCPECVAQGVHCFTPEHRLAKRVLRNGRYVDMT